MHSIGFNEIRKFYAIFFQMDNWRLLKFRIMCVMDFDHK